MKWHVRHLHALARDGAPVAFFETPDLETRIRPYKGAIKRIRTSISQGDSQNAWHILTLLQSRNPQDFEIPFLIYKCLLEGPQGGDSEVIVQYSSALNECLKLIGSDLRYEHYIALLGALNGLAHFHTSYILSLLLIVLVKTEITPYCHAAFPAFQLGRTFRWILHVINQLDPALAFDMLDRSWIYERLQTADSLEGVGLSEKALKQTEESAECIAKNAWST